MNIKTNFFIFSIPNTKVEISRLYQEVKATVSNTLSHIDRIDDDIFLFFTEEINENQKEKIIDLCEIIVSNDVSSIVQRVNEAIEFGQRTLNEFIVENVLLEITKKNLTSHVRRVTAEIIQCLQTGSLYDAIEELKKINPNDLDDVILSPERLLTFRNKIHSFLKLPLASTWNQ